MIESVLIANRGEIACRIIRTCRRLGVRTIAVFSDADRRSLHVAMADETHRIGPAEASRSYLRPDAIVEAALRHRAAAIHPGYGFLAERVELAEHCLANGLTWIGPAPRAIAIMGSKAESKDIARGAGVPVVPGTDGALSPTLGLDAVEARARSVGYPLLIKAVSGGGGKGMRRVDDPGALARSLALAQREAAASFGDDRVVLERLLARPRHIEVQIAGDAHGNVVHFFERECSVQRHYQKVIEEAPAPNLPDAVRRSILDAAVRIGLAIRYDSLGTVEFILESDAMEPYFLEMNTRIQVEHGVTEMITGCDLVELQLRIASGERLPMSQDAIVSSGVAVEARVNAENPAADYRPNLGRITVYDEPDDEDVRVDSGVREGDEITPYYDSMIAKVIAAGATRDQAVSRLERALARFVVLGVGTNQRFLRDILRHPAFARAIVTTRFIDEAFAGGWTPPDPDERALALAAIASVAGGRGAAPDVGRDAGPWATLAGFRLLARARTPGRAPVSVRLQDGDPVVVSVVAHADGLDAEVRGRAQNLRATLDGPGLRVDGADGTHRVPFRIEGPSVAIFDREHAWTFDVGPLVESLAATSAPDLRAGADVWSDMPGLITAVQVAIGQKVTKGDPVIIMESMKLTYSIAAPSDGAVRAIHCAPGDRVIKGARLVEIDPDPR